MEQARKRKKAPKRIPPWVGILSTSLLALVVSVFIGTTKTFFVPSDSMIPTLIRGDQLWTDVYFAKQKVPKRGEIWVFTNPDEEDESGTERLVKRVVGLPGEKIQVKKGRLYINGKPLEEPYVREPMRYDTPPTKLEEGELWMLGDNRNYSGDSHRFGPVNRALLIGKAFARFWPLDRFKRF
jgi:signal peptidase I